MCGRNSLFCLNFFLCNLDGTLLASLPLEMGLSPSLSLFSLARFGCLCLTVVAMATPDAGWRDCKLSGCGSTCGGMWCWYTAALVLETLLSHLTACTTWWTCCSWVWECLWVYLWVCLWECFCIFVGESVFMLVHDKVSVRERVSEKTDKHPHTLCIRVL